MHRYLPKDEKKPEKEIFEKKPKQSPAARPAKSKKEEKSVEKPDSLFEDTSHIKKGALRKALNVSPDYKFTLSALHKIAKTEDGNKFVFQGRSYKMTRLMRQRVTLAINFMS